MLGISFLILIQPLNKFYTSTKLWPKTLKNKSTPNFLKFIPSVFWFWESHLFLNPINFITTILTLPIITQLILIKLTLCYRISRKPKESQSYFFRQFEKWLRQSQKRGSSRLNFSRDLANMKMKSSPKKVSTTVVSKSQSWRSLWTDHLPVKTLANHFRQTVTNLGKIIPFLFGSVK